MAFFTKEVLALLSGLSLFVATGLHDSFWTPFMPNELLIKRLSPSNIGIIVSASDFTSLVTCLIAMMFRNIKNRRLLFCLGSFLLGILCLIFSQIQLINSTVILLAASVIIRSSMGAAITLLWCNGSAIFIALFPNDTGKICSALAMSLCLGMIIGPPFGSFFYAMGGFQFPFYAAGVLQITLASCCYSILPDNTNESSDLQFDEFSTSEIDLKIDEDKNKFKQYQINISVYDYLSNPGVAILSCAAILGGSSTGFYLVSFSSYLFNEFQISSELAGKYFLPFTIARAFSSPAFGFLIDKGFGVFIFIVCGCITNVLGLALLGFSAFFEPNLFFAEVFTVIVGASASATFVSLIPLLRNIFLRMDSVHMDTINMYNSALYCGCFGIGMVIGQSLFGGVVMEYLGFHWSCLSHAAGSTVAGIFATFYLLKDELGSSKDIDKIVLTN